MARKVLSERKAVSISNGLFLIGLGVLVYTGYWWPGILLVLWASISSRQWFTGRRFEAFVSSIIFLGIFFCSFVNLDWAVFIPALFIVGGLFLIIREYFFRWGTGGEDKSEEIEEDADV